MKKLLSAVVLVFSILNVNAQGEIMYKSRDIVQRDSISNDLISKGYLLNKLQQAGLYINLQTDKTFSFYISSNENKDISKNEFYAKINETKATIKTLDNYLSSIDKFTGEKTYYGGGSIVSFMKVTGKGKSSQYVSINVNGSTLNYGCYGVSILFENGKKIIRSKEKVDTDYNDSGWQYKAFFTPTLNEITLLKTQKISTVKLYIYDAEINENESITILEDAKIILTTPKKIIK
jgi:hypothetical protein